MNKRVAGIIAILSLFLFVSGAHATLMDGLVAFYSFEGNANDQSGNGNNGTEYGAMLSTDRNGNANSAYRFDGVDDYIIVPHDSSIDFAFSSFSFSLWMRSDGEVPGGQQKFLDKRRGPGVGTGYNFLLDEGGHLFMTLQGGSPNLSLHSNQEIDDGLWHHVAGVVDRDANESALYIDGALDISGATVAFDLSNTGPLYIGARYTSVDYFRGDLDEIRIYDRVLTTVEIGELAVPEPSILALLGIGLIACGFTRRKNKVKAVVERCQPMGHND